MDHPAPIDNMAAPAQVPNDEVAVLHVPSNTKGRIEFISQQRQKVIQALAQQSRKSGSIPDPNTEPSKSLLPRLDMILRWMDESLQMTPEIRDKTKIDLGLQLIFDNPSFHFADHHIQKARELYQKWKEDKWGANEVVEDDETMTEEGPEGEVLKEQSKTRKVPLSDKVSRSGNDEATELATLRLPPPNHPIFGKAGIMHGIAYTSGHRKTPMLDPRYSKRAARVYGQNGLKVGAWFPMRLVALFRGAHGSPQGGIAGNKETGAYSIVVSGLYEDLDKDEGDILYYSGSNSHDNEDPRAPPSSTAGTIALIASISSGNPVRVLRTSKGKSLQVPVVGLRYDGLYRVVSKREPLNLKGGKYEQFKMVREVGQPPIDLSRPTASEVQAYGRISHYY